MSFYVDHLWHNAFHFADGRILDVQRDLYDFPSFISVTDFKPDETQLSARALSCAANQALGQVKAATKKRAAQLYIRTKLRAKDENTAHLDKFLKKFPVKPAIADSLPAELGDKCATIIRSTGEFDVFVKLYSLGKAFGTIYVPIRMHRHANKFLSTGWCLRRGILITGQNINFRWSKDEELTSNGDIVGADQGRKTCISLSDGQTTGRDIHGHDLESIIQELTRKKKGSRSFKRKQAHRANYINWSIKQLDLTGIRELRLEKLFQMRTGERTCRAMTHFSYPLIRTAIQNLCFADGVRFTEQSSAYRSQRCSKCGFVCNKNRKGKIFKCRDCGFILDSDINAAKNHAVDLIPIPFGFQQKKLNRTAGFFWRGDGLFSSGQELIVPDTIKL